MCLSAAHAQPGSAAPSSAENAREGRSQGFDLDFSQQESASENKFGCTSAPLTKRLQA